MRWGSKENKIDQVMYLENGLRLSRGCATETPIDLFRISFRGSLSSV